MGPLCRGPVWMPITPKRGPFCTPIHTLSQPSPKECIRDAMTGYAPDTIKQWSKALSC